MTKYYFILIAICFSLSISAQVDRSKAPASGPAPKVVIGEYKSFTLKNGLKVLVIENNKVPKINLNLNIIRDEIIEGDKCGYTSIMGDLWSKATTNRNAKQLSEDVDFMGAQLGATSKNVYLGGLSKFSGQLFDLFADIVLNPSFPQDEFDKLVLQNKTALKTAETNPASILNNIKNVTMFHSDHPYGEVMTAATIDNITVDDCKKYYNQYVHPNNSMLVIVGDITVNEAKKMAEKYLGKWKTGTAPHFTYSTPQEPKGLKVVFSNKDAASQASVEVAYPLDFKPDAPDIIAAKVMNYILGGGDFQAKLFRNLRETKGYTYGAYSRLSPNLLQGSGSFSAAAEVKANVADSSFIEILKEMRNMTDGNFSREDVERVKKTMAGSFSRSLESPSTIADFAYSIERYGLPKDYYTNYLTELSNLSREDILSVAKKYIHPANAYLFVVGDRSLKPQLAELATDGKVTELDHEGNPVAEGPKVAAGVTAQSVVDAYLNAIGGAEAVRKIKDMSITSEMSIQGMTITNSYQYVIAPGKPVFKMEVSMAGNVMQKMIFDGEKAVISGAGGSQTLEGEQAKALKEQAYPILEPYYQELGMDPTIEGVEKVNGRDAYKLKVTLGEAVTYSFYDVENGLKVKSVGTQGGVSQELTYEEYKPVDGGIKYPFLNKTSMQGMPIELKVTDVKINSGLKAADLK